jgi:TolA-binding protein
LSPEQALLLLSAFTGGGGLVALLRFLVERRTARADAAATLTEAASELVGDLQAEVSRLRGRIGELEGLVQAQAGAIEGLRRELATAGRRIQALEQENRELARINLRAGG